MSVEIHRVWLRVELKHQNQVLQSILDQITPLQSAINAYTSDPNLGGMAFGSHGNYLKLGHLPILTDLRSGINALMAMNDRHVTATETHLEHLYYNQQQIENDISTLTAQINTWWFWTLEKSGNLQNWTKGVRERLANVRNKRERLQNYLAATNTIYTDIDAIMANIERNLIRIEFTTITQNPDGSFSFALPPDDILNELMEKDIKTQLSELDEAAWEIIEELLSRDLRELSQQERNALEFVFGILANANDFDRLFEVIRNTDGDGAFKWVLEHYKNAHAILANGDFPPHARDALLVLQKLQDYRIRVQIDEIDQLERFSQAVWDAASLEEREHILREYTIEIARIMGVAINEVNFSALDRPSGTLGLYSHRGNSERGFPERTVWINPSRIDPANDGQRRQSSLVSALGTIRHEVRHAYQYSTLDDVGAFPPKSHATIRAWWDNRKNFIFPPEPLPAGRNSTKAEKAAHNEQWRAYRNQPLELDAFGFGNEVNGEMPGWSPVEGR